MDCFGLWEEFLFEINILFEASYSKVIIVYQFEIEAIYNIVNYSLLYNLFNIKYVNWSLIHNNISAVILSIEIRWHMNPWVGTSLIYRNIVWIHYSLLTSLPHSISRPSGTLTVLAIAFVQKYVNFIQKNKKNQKCFHRVHHHSDFPHEETTHKKKLLSKQIENTNSKRITKFAGNL